MADQLQFRGGTTTEHSTFTGALRELTVDTTKKTIVVHDGATLGGNPLARENNSNLTGNTTVDQIRFADADRSNYIGLKAPTTITTNLVLTLPSADGTSGQVLSTNGSGALSWASLGSFTNSQIASNAAIDYSKLAPLSSGNILIGNGSNVATSVAVTGDVTISSSGETAIAAGSIVNSDISASAAIADTKLATIASAGKVSNSATTASSANTANAIVARDSAGNFSANVITGNLNGTASRASQLDITRGIQGVSFDGTADITVVTAGNGISVNGTEVKLAPLTSGNILVGNGSNVASPVALSGDVTITNTGVASVVQGSTSVAGKLQLTNGVNSASTTTAATPAAVNTAYNLADSANTTAQAALPKSGGTMTGNITFASSQTFSDAAGNLRTLPQNAKTAAYTLVANDTGKHISITTGGVTVPSNVFNAGDIVTIFNNSTSDQTITQGSSVTLRKSGSADTGNRTLAQYGVATVLCVSANTFVISGSGLS